MTRGRKASVVKLDERQKALLEKHFNKRTIAMQTKERIHIILGAEQGKSNTDIVALVQVSRHTVSKWRKRWSDGYAQLCEYGQQDVSEHELLNRMLLVLSDAARSGTPETISLSEKQNLIALACQNPQELGIPITQWSHDMLAKVAVAEGLVKRISPSHVGNILKKK